MYFGFENEELMGKQICNITYRQLVKLGAVLPYEILVLTVNSEDIKNFISSFDSIFFKYKVHVVLVYYPGTSASHTLWRLFGFLCHITTTIISGVVSAHR